MIAVDAGIDNIITINYLIRLHILRINVKSQITQGGL